ncbi:VWA domain-containing protein [Nocardioides zeae]|uniref:VWA domain-containing protein n=1 Tax=Nocardioides imazamoxiresistens TaxID=3231893 RepID=A0ABU3Q193_9ACTN|nr:VWA domain-containing protein [Nocardioides zeae]MDT9595277.1 VWA domain-containing protein [Nocardioides zeae]
MTIDEHRSRPTATAATTVASGPLAVLLALLLSPGVALLPASTSAAAAPAAPSPAVADPDDDPARTVLVLDASGSMAEPTPDGSTRIEAARAAVTDVVNGLPDDAEVGLRVYGATVDTGDGACEDSQLVVPVGTGNRDDLRAAVAAYEPLGETPIAYALQQAAADLGPEGERSIVLVSDGEATCDPDPCTVAGQIAESGVDLRVDVVGLDVDGDARAQLRCVAAAAGGTYVDAADAGEIAEGIRGATERALNPFALDGTPIEGGPSLEEATDVGAGVWVDEISADADRWFRYERTYPDSTVHVAAATLGTTDDAADRVVVETLGGPDLSCGSGSDLKQLNTARIVAAGASAGPLSRFNPEECSGDAVWIRVERDFSTLTDGIAPYRLQVVEEPPAENLDELPERTSAFDAEVSAPLPGDATPITPGYSFASAAETTTGTYAASVVPGETHVYRVRLEAGQSLQVGVSVPPQTEAARQALGGGYRPADVQLYNPLGGHLTTPSAASASGRATSDAGEELTTATAAVTYRNRTGSLDAEGLAGWYYVVYAVDAADVGVEQPYELSLEVVGEPAGQPTYPDGQEVLGLDGPGTVEQAEKDAEGSGEADDTEGPGEDRDAAEDGTSGGAPVAVLVSAGLGAAGLVCVVAGFLVLRRRRG